MSGIRIVLATALLAIITGCGSSYSSSPSTPSPTPAPAGASTTVTIPANARTLGTGAYVPNPATVSQGTSVTWSNTDSTTHDMVADNGAFDSGRVGPNGAYSFTFTQRGTYAYHCSIHPSMTGTIVVQ
jgi:plastocyanin